MARHALFVGSKNPNGNRNYHTALVDAGIIAGFTFFSSLGGGALVNALMQGGSKGALIIVVGAGISAGIAFFSSLLASLQVRKADASGGS